jgi:hypothetical protein
MKKKCGGCQHFTKLKNDQRSSGLCQLLDTRCGSDYSCSKWKAIGYRRLKTKASELPS